MLFDLTVQNLEIDLISKLLRKFRVEFSAISNQIVWNILQLLHKSLVSRLNRKICHYDPAITDFLRQIPKSVNDPFRNYKHLDGHSIPTDLFTVCHQRWPELHDPLWNLGLQGLLTFFNREHLPVFCYFLVGKFRGYRCWFNSNVAYRVIILIIECLSLSFAN